jgi:XTP/dITP diphosphohydrolase
MTTLLLATRNGHKGQEIRSILGDEFDYLSLNDFPGAPNVVEDADSFTGNATRKAVQLAEWLSRREPSPPKPPDRRVTHIPRRLSLEVDALNGAPGVHSARSLRSIALARRILLTQRTTRSCSVCSRTCPPANVAPDFGT